LVIPAAVTTNQRGLPRISGGVVDIGTVDVQQTTGPTIGSFTLVNADTDKDVMTLADGAMLDLSKLPRRLNVRANVSGSAGSARIGIDGHNHIDLAAPYALFNDLAGDYAAGTFADGSHMISARGFAGPNATGTAGAVNTIHISVINKPVAATGAVTSMVLFNTSTNQDIKVLKDFDTVDLSLLPDTLGIRVTRSGVVNSIRYVVDAQVNVPATNALKAGSHTITALPFAGINGTGVQGASKQLRLFVVRSV